MTGPNGARKVQAPCSESGEYTFRHPIQAESLMSCAGQIMPPEGYFKHVYKHCRDNGTLCIADEVQVGFGRVGSHMWAYEVKPNLMPSHERPFNLSRLTILRLFCS